MWEPTKWGPLTPTDWGTLATAVFTAIAAGAAWRAVTSQRKAHAAATKPNLSGTFAVVGGDEPHQRIEVVNAGPGLAIGTAYFGVNRGRKFGSHLGKPNLLPNEKTHSLLPHGFVEGQSVEFIWWCRDLDGRQLAWSYRGGYLELRPSVGDWPGESELFGRLYPDTPIPRGEMLQFPVE
jgi:hypothetical protein